MGDSRIPEQLLTNAKKWHILESSLKCHLVVDYGEAMAEGRSAEHVAREGRPGDFSWAERGNLARLIAAAFEANAVET